MNNYRIFFFSILSILLFNCNSESDLDVLFTNADIVKIDGNSSKTWKVEYYYNNYNSKILNELNDCFVDDTFTFYKDNNIAEAKLDNISCFFNNPTEEAASLKYTLDNSRGRIFINISRGESFNGKFQSRLTILELQELSDNRMLFASGEKGNYMQTLILTAVN